MHTPAGKHVQAQPTSCANVEVLFSQYTMIEYIERVILALQGRLMNIHDLPKLAPFFFVEPDRTLPEDVKMRAGFANVDYGSLRFDSS